MIPAEEIEEFLKGSDPEQYIVSVEFDYVSDSIYKIIEDPIKGKIVKRDTFIPFAWVGDLRSLNFYSKSKALIIAVKSAAFSAAPPIRPPSTSSLPNISLALPGFTLPP